MTEKYRLCSDCERKNINKIAHYETLPERFSYKNSTGNRKIFLCEDCLKEKTHDQIKRAKSIYKYAKDPTTFLPPLRYEGGKYTR